MCAISIKIPIELLDTKIEELELPATLKQSNCKIFIKAPFRKAKSHNFISFEASEKQEAIIEFLEKEIDF